MKGLGVFLSVLLVLALPAYVVAQEEEAPPLPLHSIEGPGGVLITHSAYLINPAAEGEVLGLPTIGVGYVRLGHGRSLSAITITETLWDRLELGYTWNQFDMADLPKDIEKATGLRPDDDHIDLHNLNARVMLLNEGEFELPWVPAVTFGVHCKLNEDIDNIDEDIGRGLKALGIEDHNGFDFTLYMSKKVTALERPLLLSLGARSTKAAHLGLLGFAYDREIVLEANAILLVTDQLGIAAEYREKPNQHEDIPGIIEEEEDWWTLCACYVFNNNLTMSGGYGHFGEVFNHRANNSWGLKVKWEF